MKNHFGVKWFYIEPSDDTQMVLYRTFKEPLEGS